MSGGVARLFHRSASSGLQSSIAPTRAFVEAPHDEQSIQTSRCRRDQSPLLPAKRAGKSALTGGRGDGPVSGLLASCDVLFQAVRSGRAGVFLFIASMRSRGS